MDRGFVAWSETVAFFAALYAGLLLAGLALDGTVGVAELPVDVRLPGVVLILLGALGLAWSFALFVREGHGTPNPVLPPRALVTVGPFAWTRNPITISHFLATLGVALLVRSPSMVFLVLVLGFPVYLITRHEEERLEGRFGDAYRSYKRSVPRFLPRPPRRQSR